MWGTLDQRRISKPFRIISVQGAEGQSILKASSILQNARDGSIRTMNCSDQALPPVWCLHVTNTGMIHVTRSPRPSLQYLDTKFARLWRYCNKNLGMNLMK